MKLLKSIAPFAIGIALFLLVSAIVQNNFDFFRSLLTGPSQPTAMAAYFLLGVLSVLVPFGSLIPFIPIATTLWGWQWAIPLTLVSWVLGAQILFEFARYAGKPVVTKWVQESQLKTIRNIIQGRSLFRSILIRMIIQDDIVSYAFALFTDMSRADFFIMTTVGVAPAAVLYCLFGTLPLVYQLGIGALAAILIVIYWLQARLKE